MSSKKSGAVTPQTKGRWPSSRSAGRQVGTKGWSFSIEQRDDGCLLTPRRPRAPCRRDRTRSGARAECRRPPANGWQQCAGRDRDCDHVGAARHSGYGWSRRAEWPRGPNDRAPFPVAVAGITPQDDAGLTAAPGHRGNPGQAAQRVIVSSAQGLPSLVGLQPTGLTRGEQRGEVDPSEPWHRAQDHHVALLAMLPRLVPLGRNELATELGRAGDARS